MKQIEGTRKNEVSSAELHLRDTRRMREYVGQRERKTCMEMSE